MDERKNEPSSLRTSEATPKSARASGNMCSSCQSRPAFAGTGFQQSGSANYCAPQVAQFGSVSAGKRIERALAPDLARLLRATRKAFAALAAPAQDALAEDIVALLERLNVAGKSLLVPSEYLEVVIVKH